MNKHHTDEQMEALRLNFEKLWEAKIIPVLESSKVSFELIPLLRHVAWVMFKEGKVKE